MPLENLQRVEQFLREVELRIPGVMAGMFSGPGAKAYVASSLPGVRAAWAEVRDRKHAGRAVTASRDFDEAFRRFQALLPRLEDALAREDKKQLATLADEWLDLKRMVLKPLNDLLTGAREEVAAEVKMAERRQWQVIWAIAIGLGSLLVVMIPVSVALLRGISGPLRQAVAVLTDLAKDLARGQGDLTTRLPVTTRDEIGEIAQAFNAFMETLEAIVGQARQAAGRRASSPGARGRPPRTAARSSPRRSRRCERSVRRRGGSSTSSARSTRSRSRRTCSP